MHIDRQVHVMKSPHSNENGFSLTELIVIMGLISILLSIATINFNQWQNKAFIERDTRELQASLTDLRQKAMTRKLVHTATINAGNYLFKQFTSASDDGNATKDTIQTKVAGIPLSNASGTPWSNLVITFDDRGYTSDNATIVVGPADSFAAVNCLVVSTARINLGKMNGGKCEFQ